MIKYEKVTKENIIFATKIQMKIFPKVLWNNKFLNIKEMVNKELIGNNKFKNLEGDNDENFISY